MGAISGGLGAGTSAIMSGAELTVGRVMAVKAMNMVSDATVDSVYMRITQTSMIKTLLAEI